VACVLAFSSTLRRDADATESTASAGDARLAKVLACRLQPAGTHAPPGSRTTI